MDLPDLGPLSVLICWQSLLLSFVVATITHGVKSALDYSIEGGKEERKKMLFANRIVLPATPIAIGAIIAVFVPLHPDTLLQYIAEHKVIGGNRIGILMAYGSCLGQFSDYVWHRFSGITSDVKKKGEVAEAKAVIADAVVGAVAVDAAAADAAAEAAAKVKMAGEKVE